MMEDGAIHLSSILIWLNQLGKKLESTEEGSSLSYSKGYNFDFYYIFSWFNN
jgi:hypothetical protein